MKASIMQPTYLPWMGYFGMMESSDIFVFYDDVQFEKRSWQQRNRIQMPPGNSIWLTVPVIHNRETEIKDIKISHDTNWRDLHWKSIYHAYHKAPFFKDYEKAIENIYRSDWVKLGDMNLYIIRLLASLLDIKIPRTVKSSELNGIQGNKTDRLLSILHNIGINEYVASPGSKDYIEAHKFLESGIKLYWYEFQHPDYPQKSGDFIPYLSVIDLLCNTGSQAGLYIRQGLKNSLKLDDIFLNKV
jgi:hypothetical protein